VNNATSAGTCFGFEIRSSLPFNYLRGGSGQPMEISAPSRSGPDPDDELLSEWTPTREIPLTGRLYQAVRGYRLWIDGAGWFEVDPEAGTIVLPDSPDLVRREERLWGIPAMLCFLARGDLPLHAAAVEIDGGAVVLGAPRAHGKTTLAAAFLEAGLRLLSEDVACVRPGQVPQVIPGPAMLRIRPDIARALEVRTAMVVGQGDDRVHYAIDPAVRGDCNPLPLRAVFLLRTSDAGVRVERVPPAEAVRDLWPLSSRLPTPRGLTRCFEDLVDVVARVPVWNLYRPLRISDLPRTIALISETL
jgi:hypothetical protein